MLSLVVRRAIEQRWMLVAVIALVAVATTLIGLCTLLLGVTGPRAFAEQVRRTPAAQVDVSAYLVDVRGSDVAAVRSRGEDAVRRVLAGLDPTLTTSATFRMRRLGERAFGYLAATDDVASRARLTSGRWPAQGSASEAIAPEAAASRLHLRLGQRVILGAENGLSGDDRPVGVVVVGTYRPASRAPWVSDPLSGAGYDPVFANGAVPRPAYGPFLQGEAALGGGASNLTGLRVVGHPRVAQADDERLSAAAARIDSASRRLTSDVGGSAGITRVASELPDTLDRMHAQQRTTRSAVLVVLLLGTALALAALVLAGQLVSGVRATQRLFLVSIGLSRRQELGLAVVEAALLSVVAVVLGVPGSAFAYAATTRLPDVRAARLSQDPTVTPALVTTVVAAAFLLALVLTLVPLVTWDDARFTERRRLLARTGADAVLVLVAAASWWQLQTPAAAGDLVLLVAPVTFLLAVTIVVVRVLPAVLTALAAAITRSRGLMPLALWPAAARLRGGTALVLLATAAAAATSGLALQATWQRSQREQADLRIGTGASLTLASAASAADAGTIEQAAGPGSGPSPVTDRPIALGRYVGGVGDPPALVALDMRRASALLTGRLPGRTWVQVGRRLAPPSPVRGVPLARSTGAITVTGRASGGAVLTVTPTLVVEDRAGFRGTLTAAAVPLDGRPHPLALGSVEGGSSLVAMRLLVTGLGVDPRPNAPAIVSDITLTIPGPGAGAGGARVADGWSIRSMDRQAPTFVGPIHVRRGRSATTVSTRISNSPDYLAYVPADLLATAFIAPPAVPVAVSARLADALGAKVGSSLSATVGETSVVMRVLETMPNVPSAPGRTAVLADADLLSRTLIDSGVLDPAVDAFWFTRLPVPSQRSLRALQLGELQTRPGAARELLRGPLQVTVPVSYLTLVGASVLMLLAGAALLVSTDRRRRSVEVARIRALGLTRRRARRLLVLEECALLVPLVLSGVLVGLLAAWLLIADLIRSDRGTPPIPEAVVVWPWVAEAALSGGLVLAAVVIAVVASGLQVRRADPARLRADEW